MGNLSIQERVFNLLESSNLNWSVEKLQFPAPIDGYELPNAYGMYAKGEYLGTTGSDYSILQNSELAHIFLEAVDLVGLDGTVRAGSFAGKKKVWFQAQIKDAYVAKDTIKRNITGINTHNGSSSVGFGTTNTVISCANTFFRAFATLVKVRHSGAVKERVEEMARNLVYAIEAEEKVIRNFTKMSQEIIQPKLVSGLIEEIFSVKPTDKLEELSTRKQNQLTKFSEAIKGELDRHGKTVWGLFNGVTYYTNYLSKPEKADRIEYVMDRQGAKNNNKAYEYLTRELIEVSN